jgi:hypothetical protein
MARGLDDVARLRRLARTFDLAIEEVGTSRQFRYVLVDRNRKTIAGSGGATALEDLSEIEKHLLSMEIDTELARAEAARPHVVTTVTVFTRELTRNYSVQTEQQLIDLLRARWRQHGLFFNE